MFPAIFALILVLAPSPIARQAVAAPLEGAYEISFTGSESIWPLAAFQDCETGVIDGNDVAVCVELSLNRSAAGGVDGSGTFDFEVLGIGVDIQGILAGTLKGKIKGTDKKGYKQTVSLKFKGPVSVAGVGESLPASMTGKLITEITPAGLVESKGKLTVKVKRGGKTRAKLQTGLRQIEEGSGDWVLKLLITASSDKTKLSGTAELVLPDGSHFIPIAGKYKPKRDKAEITAKGKSSNKGMKLRLKNLRSDVPGSFKRGTADYQVKGFSGRKSLKLDERAE